MNKSLREALLQNKEALREALRLVGSQGGKEAAKRMTKAERVARAKKAAAASAKVRARKSKRKGEG
jgi:hypothetical protein